MENLANVPYVDDAARDRVTVSGPDAQTYLQSQIAQEIRDQPVGETRWTLVLEPTGKIGTLARITRTDDETFVLDTDAGYGEDLLKRINRFKIRVKADTELSLATSEAPSDDHEASRVAAGWPRMGHEIIPGETIPAVTSVVDVSVNFTKGCYPGQELVERMDSRGADAPKSLRIVDVADGTQPGAAVHDATGAEVGTVTSVSGTLGLAYIKRGNDIGRAPIHAS